MKLIAHSNTFLRPLFLLLIGVSLFYSCETRYEVIDSGIDYCPDEIDMGNFALTSISRDKYPYAPQAGSKIIFSDSLGNEVEGILAQRGNISSLFNLEVSCVNNENQEINLMGDRDYFIQSLIFESLNISFSISQYVFVDFDNYEKRYAYDIGSVNMRYIEPITQENWSIFMSFILDQRNTPASEVRFFFMDDPLVSFSIHGKEFLEVYKDAPFGTDQEPEYYYNHTEGLVAFEDPATNIRYKLERIE